MIEDHLTQLGFNPKEIEVYLTILKHGKLTPANIAKITGIKRPTVYSTTKELAKKGVIVEDLGEDQSSFLALPPDELNTLVYREEEKIKSKKQVALKAVAELQEFTKNTKYSVPKIKFVYEENLDNYLRSQYEQWEESGKKYDNTWWGYHDHSFTEQYSDWIAWTWKHYPKDLRVRFLSNEAPIEKEMQKKFPERQTRFLKDSKFDTSLWTIGDYIIMAQTRVKPHYLVEIHDPVLARNQTELFKKIWESGE
jgi:sugar-specific transcriptional regulator TrmB